MACGAASLPCKHRRIAIRVCAYSDHSAAGRALELGELLQQRLHLLHAIYLHIPVVLLLLWLVVGTTPALV